MQHLSGTGRKFWETVVFEYQAYIFEYSFWVPGSISVDTRISSLVLQALPKFIQRAAAEQLMWF